MAVSPSTPHGVPTGQTEPTSGKVRALDVIAYPEQCEIPGRLGWHPQGQTRCAFHQGVLVGGAEQRARDAQMVLNRVEAWAGVDTKVAQTLGQIAEEIARGC